MDTVFGTITYEFRSFVRYLLSVWGILSVISPFFPHYDELQKYVPPPESNSQLCVTLAMIVCGSVVLYRFITRSDLDNKPTLIYLLLAIFLTLVYIFVMPDWKDIDVGEVLGISPERTFILLSLHSITKLIAPIWYIIIFYVFTNTFTSLAVYEWKKHNYR